MSDMCPSFDKWEKEIAANDARLKAIGELSDAMLKEESVFDQRDQDLVKQQEVEILKRQAVAVATLTERKRVFETEVKTLQEQLQKRASVMNRLSEESNVFEFFPDIADKFAREEAALRQKISELCKQLEK
jgi:hypothetical protein